MIQNMSFEDIFLKACDFIGYSEEELIQTLGEPDQIDTGANGNRYLIYNEVEVMFEISHSRGILICAQAPVRPDPTRIREGFYNLLGAKVGDSVERVYQMWGNPSAVDGIELIYNTKLGTTSKGLNFETRIAIKNGSLVDFSGILFIQSAPKPKSGCFVATACYGDYNAEEVLVLREFRDKVLLNTLAGQAFVKFYYYVSPPIANVIEKSSILKTFIRNWFLSPIIRNLKKH